LPWIFAAVLLIPAGLPAQRVMERLGRGLIAIGDGTGKVYVGWRLWGTDPDAIAFNVYRSTAGAEPVKLNAEPITKTTDYVDATADLSKDNSYFVRAVTGGAEGEACKPFKLPAGPVARHYLSVPIQKPPDSEVMGRPCSYTANDAAVGDLDGDGEYEIVLKWEPSISLRPPQPGFTGDVILDAYKMDGTLMWRIHGGKNVRVGPPYTFFLVYDFDGDGKAEVAFRTCDGSIDGTGKVIGDPKAEWRNMDMNSQIYGKVLTGPEYLTIFNGETGAAMDTQECIPSRFPLDSWWGIGGNGGDDGEPNNRGDHYSGCVAYLDGHLPSIIWARGWYGRTVLVASDFRNGKLTKRWTFDSLLPKWYGYSGMGNHQVTVQDFDGDGKDEIDVGAMTVDDNGDGLYTTGLRHGDALHAGDLDPTRPGLEVFGVHENEEWTTKMGTPGSALYDGKTGRIIWANNPGVDVGRGMTADIDPNYPGEECWGAPGGVRRIDTGETIYPETPRSTNFAVWWDADLLRELEDRTGIWKWNWNMKQDELLLGDDEVLSNNGSKATPCLTADIFGDWREEVVWRKADDSELRIYSTVIPAENRMYTLMHDPAYREAVAWQNVAYNQPPHPSFYIGPGMAPPPKPNIVYPPAR
jgi:rhamnogalacturonan endolyase